MGNNKKSQVVIVAVALVVIVLGTISAIYFYNQKQTEVFALQNKNEDLSIVLEERDSVVNELVDAFTQIEENLKFVTEKRKQLSLENQKEGKLDSKQAIIDDITLMNEMLEESSRQIAKLEKKLKNSGFALHSFKKKLAALNQTIDKQNTQIAELKTAIEDRDIQIAGLNNQVDEMQTKMARQADTIESKQLEIIQKIGELNKAYMAYGTYKELKEKGLLTKDGGFLWMGRNKTILEDFDQDYFTELNIQDTKLIPLHAKKAKVVSEHPNNSYTLVEEDGMVAYLKINNPEEFWRISKYAVIEVK